MGMIPCKLSAQGNYFFIDTMGARKEGYDWYEIQGFWYADYEFLKGRNDGETNHGWRYVCADLLDDNPTFENISSVKYHTMEAEAKENPEKLKEGYEMSFENYDKKEGTWTHKFNTNKYFIDTPNRKAYDWYNREGFFFFRIHILHKVVMMVIETRDGSVFLQLPVNLLKTYLKVYIMICKN